jgi:phosphopantetheinyl transferase
MCFHLQRVNPVEKIIEILPSDGTAAASIAVASLDEDSAGIRAARVKADQLLRQLATRMLATENDDWEVRHRSDRGPCLYRAGERSDLSASVAHSGAWVAVAVGLGRRSSIGVDIQVQDERQRRSEIADFISLNSIAENSPQQFFACWTLREAIAKATNGSVLTPHALEPELTAACENPGELVRTGSLWAMVDVIQPDVHLAVALNSGSEELKCA